MKDFLIRILEQFYPDVIVWDLDEANIVREAVREVDSYKVYEQDGKEITHMWRNDGKFDFYSIEPLED